MPFWEGLGFGLATAFLIGPVFFTLLRAALDHGKAGGLAVAMGILASDIVVLFICRTGLLALVHTNILEAYIALAAGCILVGLGIWYIAKPHPKEETRGRLGRKNAIGLMTTGFLVNFVNPFVFMVWTGFTLHAAAVHSAPQSEFVFLFAILLGIFLTDLGKAWFAPLLKRLLVPEKLKVLYRWIGIAMLVFSVRVFIHAWIQWP